MELLDSLSEQQLDNNKSKIFTSVDEHNIKNTQNTCKKVPTSKFE